MQLFVQEVIVWLAKPYSNRRRQLMMPKIISKSHDLHVLKTMPAQHKNKKTLGKTGAVPAKYSPKVKVENSSQL